VQEEAEEALSRMGRGAISILAGMAVGACLLLAAPAGAATLIGDYQFQGTKESSGPGSSLSGLNDIGTFQTENVMGTTRQVLAFAQGTGLRTAPSTMPSTSSVVMTFRLLDDTDYNRILDWSAGTDDNGIYDHNRKASYYRPGLGEAVDSPGTVFGSNSYSTLAVTMSAGASPLTRAFVNGAQVLQSPHSEPPIGGYLTFFVDNTSGGTTHEESAGAASCIRIYSGILTDAEIAAIGASPDCIAHPASVQPPGGQTAAKKCKKHKKKRSAESSKKKGCKKKKKRKH
jgi:hypothetical protein